MKKLSAITIIFVLFVSLNLISCSGSSPEIHQVLSIPVYVKHNPSGALSSELLLYFHVYDDDGFTDLEKLEVRKPDNSGGWTIRSDSWDNRVENGEDWVGFPRLISADKGELDEGVYTAILSDLSGQTDQAAFNYSQPSITLYATDFPSVVWRDNKRFVIEGDHDRYMILFYDVNENYIGSKYQLPNRVEEMENILRSIPNYESIDHFYLFYYDISNSLGIRTGPHEVTQELP